jgi:hypothetical protein
LIAGIVPTGRAGFLLGSVLVASSLLARRRGVSLVQ